jgi:hypothetical protein
MHPNRVFDWQDKPEMLRFAADRSFAHIFTASDAGLFVVHVPILVTEQGTIWFHVARRNRIADIVHDADFLAKFGYLGVANFFVKSTLRGRNLESAVMDFLGKELTYAAVLPANMRTASARKLAARKSADTLRFYRAYLAELKEAHGLVFRIQTATVARPGQRAKRATVSLALPASCGSCGGKWETELRTSKGLKCEKLEASLRCSACGDKRSTSFCLPELG